MMMMTCASPQPSPSRLQLFWDGQLMLSIKSITIPWMKKGQQWTAFISCLLHIMDWNLLTLWVTQSETLSVTQPCFINLLSKEYLICWQNNVGIFFYIHYTVCATIFQGTEKQTFKYRWILCRVPFAINLGW